MGIKAQKSALPTLFNFARVRAAHQPHVFIEILKNEADLYVSILSISRDQGFRGQYAFFKTP